MFNAVKLIGVILLCSMIFTAGFKAGAKSERSDCLSEYKSRAEQKMQAYLVELKDAQRRLKIESDKVSAMNRALVMQAKKTQSIKSDYLKRLHQLSELLNEQDVKSWGSGKLPAAVIEWLHNLQKDSPRDDH